MWIVFSFFVWVDVMMCSCSFVLKFLLRSVLTTFYRSLNGFFSISLVLSWLSGAFLRQHQCLAQDLGIGYYYAISFSLFAKVKGLGGICCISGVVFKAQLREYLVYSFFRFYCRSGRGLSKFLGRIVSRGINWFFARFVFILC